MGKYEKGENNKETLDESRPPFTVDLLADEIMRYERRRMPWPAGMPRDAKHAAKWWIARQKPANERLEAPRQTSVVGQRDTRRWITPYADRLVASLRVFFKLDRKAQEFILAAHEDNVFFNGDDLKVFRRIYDETMRMRSMDFETYRTEAVAKLKKLVGAMA